MTERITLTLGDDGRPQIDGRVTLATLCLFERYIADMVEMWLYTQDEDEDEDDDDVPPGVMQ